MGDLKKVNLFSGDNRENINDIKVKWKIPNSKFSAFNCKWTKGSVNPFPFILRKYYYEYGHYN